MTCLDVLKTVEVFKSLTPEELEKIAAFCAEKKFMREDRLFAEGDPSKHFWIVQQGRVDLRFDLPGRATSEENTILPIEPGQILGWSSLVPPHRYRLSAYCATPECKTIRMKSERLLGLFEAEPSIGYRFMASLIKVVGRQFHRLQESALEAPFSLIKITVHMATCGISAGAREVMEALKDEAAKANRQGLRLLTAGCIGQCRNEPNVTVEVEGEPPVIYQKMTAERMRQVFTEHVIKGNVQTAYVLETA